ncbi:MAG: ABC transporter ATP-binding protein [Anaerolineae bacterium]|nr:ABC transporter ATP-binding protein [Anaerolineae bacterium]
MNLTNFSTYYDFRSTLHTNRLVGLWRMMADFRPYYLLAAISLAVSAMAKTAGFFLLRYFADNVLAGTGSSLPFSLNLTQFLIAIALGFMGLALVEGGFAYFSGRLAAFTAEGVTRRLRNFLFDHIQRLNFSYHSKTKTGDLIERCTSDVDALRRFFSQQAIGVGRIILLFVVNFIALLSLHTGLAWFSIISLPFILLITVWFFKQITKRYEDYQEQEAVLSTTLQENLTGVRVVKAFANQNYEIGKFEKDNLEKFRRGKLLLITHSLYWPLSQFVLGIQLLAGYIFGALLTINAEITVGTYLAYSGMVIWLLWPIQNLGRLIVDTSAGMVSYTRIMAITKQIREPLSDGKVSPAGPLKGEIVFEDVSFKYSDGSAEVLNSISFKVKPGQTVALLGSTGSGKTSLVNLLPRFHEYSNGKIMLDGVDLKDYSRKYLRRQIGIVEQEPFLFSRSIRENISYGLGRDIRGDEIEAAAKAAAIHEDIISFPDGYSTLVGERGVTLSGGQKQRVTIARILLKNPRILIFDDSTSSVDMDTEAEIRAALNRLMEGRTTFIIAHRIQTVMNADLILVLNKGNIVQKGSHKELIVQKDSIYRQMFDIQTRIDEELEIEVSQAK